MGFMPNQEHFNENPRYQQYSQYQQTPPDKRSRAMTTAAVSLSIVAVSTTCCIYISFICGVLGIIFALLSKGGEMTMSPSAKTALRVSVIAIVLTVSLTIGSFAMVIAQYGSMEAFWEAYMEMMASYGAGMTY